MPVEDGWSIIENEVNAMALLEVNLLLVSMFYAVRKFMQLPEAQPIFEKYFADWVHGRHIVKFVLERAGGFLELESKLLVFHMDDPRPPGSAWGRVVHGRKNHYDPTKPRRDIYFNPSIWARGPRFVHLEVGTDWKDLIGCETLVFHAIFANLMLGNVTPPKVQHISLCHLHKYYHMTNKELAEHLGFDTHSFDRSQLCKLVGLPLCEDAASDPYLQHLTLTNSDSFLWFCKHVWLIMQGFDLVDGKVVESDMVNTNPKIREIRDALPAVADHYYQAELV